jgi:hypothetical protein
MLNTLDTTQTLQADADLKTKPQEESETLPPIGYLVTDNEGKQMGLYELNQWFEAIGEVQCAITDGGEKTRLSSGTDEEWIESDYSLSASGAR